VEGQTGMENEEFDGILQEVKPCIDEERQR
jgi:hypothetical protein